MTYLSDVLAFSPKVHLKLGEPSGTLEDSTANNHDGTASGNVDRAQATLLTGDGGASAAFPATPGVITIADSADLDCGDVFTVIIWAKRTRSGVDESALVQRNGYGSYTIGFGVADYFGVVQQGLGDHCGTVNPIADTNRHMLAFVKNGGTSRDIFVDGVSDFDAAKYTARTFDDAFSTDIVIGNSLFIGGVDEFTLIPTALTAGQIAALWTSGTTGGAAEPTWISPADTSAIGTLTPVYEFTSPVSASAQHFELQLDTANTFDTGNLRTISTQASQTGWEYELTTDNWVAFPSTGLAAVRSGSKVRHTVQTNLTEVTWYRRVRAGA